MTTSQSSPTLSTSLSKSLLSPIEDPRSPYFLHHTDHHGSIVINPKLTSSNYCSWSHFFLLALSIRNKTRFIDGSIKQPSSTDELYSSWTRCNNLIVARLLESISEPIATNVFYMNSAAEIWQTLKNRFSQPDDTRICNLNFPCVTSHKEIPSWTMIDVAEVKAGLYLMQYKLLGKRSQGSISTSTSVTILVCNSVPLGFKLWHYRLGHISEDRMKQIKQVCPNISTKESSVCYVCLLAKQKRLPFPIHVKSSKAPFDSIHIDIWGPYFVNSIHG
ncbi:uncharacterized protein LOC110425909 isoform X1 [Herrania umbratica]|uniref:Uncharacterized protein LOC110425909 isoform X1 n=1 Tax=Herrania umbratica TaxID=108875 RepID=A0A6J1BBD3_9ROSI|nr:uncharacterized protein LOC110425909 isoform X1 [Herrania umbratica]